MIVKLSVYSIKDTIKRLEFLKDNINNASQDIVGDLVEVGETTANQINSMAIPSGTQKSIVIGRVTENGTKGYVALTGPNAVYDEFGTGEEGLASPHPMKETTSRRLNPYNSGPYVSTHINPFTGKHYWIIPDTYFVPSEYVENTGYTEGIPSGKQMYNTDNYIKFIKRNVIEQEFNKAVKKFNK